jgi:hypothetical protein
MMKYSRKLGPARYWPLSFITGVRTRRDDAKDFGIASKLIQVGFFDHQIDEAADPLIFLPLPKYQQASTCVGETGCRLRSHISGMPNDKISHRSVDPGTRRSINWKGEFWLSTVIVHVRPCREVTLGG